MGSTGALSDPTLEGHKPMASWGGRERGACSRQELVRKYQKAQEPLTSCQTFQILDCFSG